MEMVLLTLTKLVEPIGINEFSILLSSVTISLCWFVKMAYNFSILVTNINLLSLFLPFVLKKSSAINTHLDCYYIIKIIFRP